MLQGETTVISKGAGLGVEHYTLTFTTPLNTHLTLFTHVHIPHYPLHTFP